MLTICGNTLNTFFMRDKIEEILRDYQDREARAAMLFYLCFGLTEKDCKRTDSEIKRAVYDALDMLGVEE